MFGNRRGISFAVLVAAAIMLTQQVRAATLANVTVKDIFGRTVNTRGLKLVDWDGYLANPAIKFTVTVPTGAVLPASAVITANRQRVYFDTPCSVGANGPSKTIQFTSTSREIPVYISIFPDRDGLDEDLTLSIRLTDKNGSQSTTQVPIHVIDQDANSTPSFTVTADFSTDQSGFFGDGAKRGIVQQAADDWAYFIDGAGLNQVPAHSETTWIWGPDGWSSGSVGFHVTNASAYTGYLLYAYGIHTTELRSGGEGSYSGGYQHVGSTQLPLRRSGGLEVETQGNYNTLGWFVTTGDDDWWVSANYNEPNDLYSIVHHEIGHALAFCGAYPRAADAQTTGYFDDPAIVNCLGGTLPLDSSYHFGGVIDPASKRGVFGSEYNGAMVQRRWLLTKLDLLALQAVGYTLRNTSALAPLSFTAPAMPSGIVAKPYSQQLPASGGVPFYAWDVIAGALPPGLALDSFTGLVSGTPTQAGDFTFTVRVRDYSPQTASATADVAIDIEVDTASPVISSVAVTPPRAAAEDPVHVSVAVADNVAVANVKAGQTPLVLTGDTWQGSVPAASVAGPHSVIVTAADAAGNTATDSSAGYTTARVVGVTNASAKYALTTPAASRFLFAVWGRVTEADTGGLVLDDGSKHPITVIAPGHALKVDDRGRARGVLSLGPDGPVLTTTPDLVIPLP